MNDVYKTLIYNILRYIDEYTAAIIHRGTDDRYIIVHNSIDLYYNNINNKRLLCEMRVHRTWDRGLGLLY